MPVSGSPTARKTSLEGRSPSRRRATTSPIRSTRPGRASQSPPGPSRSTSPSRCSGSSIARAWQLRLTALVDAIAARAIEDGYLDLPEDHPFWGLFTYAERREVIRALSALGYRFDGLGGFADDRVPAARDLALAVGYAGLDRMRIRTWPRESETSALYEQASVAADEWLAQEADDLSLGRMVDALGSRAADLAEVWNAWGRVRPALLSED